MSRDFDRSIYEVKHLSKLDPPPGAHHGRFAELPMPDSLDPREAAGITVSVRQFPGMVTPAPPLDLSDPTNQTEDTTAAAAAAAAEDDASSDDSKHPPVGARDKVPAPDLDPVWVPYKYQYRSRVTGKVHRLLTPSELRELQRQEEEEEDNRPEWRKCVYWPFFWAIILFCAAATSALMARRSRSPTEAPTPAPQPTLSPTISAAPTTTSAAPSTRPTNVVVPVVEPNMTGTATSFLPNSTFTVIASDFESPQAKALVWVQEHPEFPTMPKWRRLQLMALLTFEYAVGKYFKRRPNYELPECQWSMNTTSGIDSLSIACDPEGRCKRFSAGGTLRKGAIPLELFLLTHLTRLDVEWNVMRTKLPTQLGILTSLTSLTVRAANVVGPIPTELSRLTSLQLLRLQENKLTGTIPEQLGNLPLESLLLQYNELTGPIPFSLPKKSKTINLEQNQLTGAVPSSIPQLTDLQWMHFRGNNIEGTLPSELCDNGQYPFCLAFDSKVTCSCPDGFNCNKCWFKPH